EVGADGDDRAGRVIDAFAQGVFAEATLLALDHVGQRLERPIARAEHRTTAAAIVKQRIDRLLKHALFVANDDLRGIEIDQLLEAVIAVDDSAIQIIQVGGSEVAALQQDQRAQVRRNDRNHIHDHPLGFVFRAADGLDHLEALGQVFDLLLAVGLFDVVAHLDRFAVELQQAKELLNGLSAHLGFELGAVLLVRGAIFLFGQKLLLFQRRLAGIGDDVVLEVDDFLDVAGLHVQQRAQSARQRLEEPDMNDRGGKIDMPHALAAHAAVSHLDTATIADDALVLRALVLAAGAFPVALGAEDALAEQAVLFGAVGTVVDGLGLLHLAERPRTNIVRAGKLNSDRAVVVNTIVDGFCHDRLLSFCVASCTLAVNLTLNLALHSTASCTFHCLDGRGSYWRPTASHHVLILHVSTQPFLLFELDIETQAADFVAEHVERHRGAGFERIGAFDHRFVNLGTSFDVVRLDGQQFLKDV